MSAIALRNQYSDLYGSGALPVLEEIVQNEYEMHPSRREQLFKVVSHDRDIWQSTEIHDLPLFSSVPENTEYSYERAMQGASKTMTVVKYGLGFSISQEAVDDGKFEFIGSNARKLGRSARESQEISAMNIFNNGFSSETTADGVALFSSSHTLPRGGTFRNILSTDSDLSQSALSTMLSDFEQVFVSDNGIIMNMRPKILLVHPDNKRYAMELVGSDLKPDTADNNLNSLKSDGLMVVSSPHLTDTDSWFVLADKENTGLRIINRRGFETKAASPELGFHTDSLYYKGSYREVLGAVHAYGVMGSDGV